MNVFEITIQHWQEEKNGWPVVAEYTRPDELPRRSEGLLSPPDGYDRKLLELTLDPHKYGTYLGRELFRETIRDGFREALSEEKANNDPLRILLVVEAPNLKPLRWERLCAPMSSGRWNFLALNQNNPFSLYLPSPNDRRFPAIGRRDLRALVLLANPPEGNTYNGGLAVFDAQKTADSISRALGEIPSGVV
ncbi:MAG: hypothetical protein D3925_06700 [Candidatus Electrothrix sp. AR5]|nr:hypothetical protein [Candidatus Electrothrix sp. AR5]